MEDTTPASGQCRTLQQQFYQFAYSQADHFYILFNSANHPQLPQQYYALDSEQHYTGLLLDLLQGYNEQSIPVMPYLVAINRDTLEQNPFIDWLFSTPETRDSFFALSSDYDLNTVAAHWDSIALVYSSQQQSVILRLFDGRISKAFLPKISLSDQQQLIGPCISFWFPNESEAPIVINNPSVIGNSPIQPAPWFHLTAHHESLLSSDDQQKLSYNLTLYLWENHAAILSQQNSELIKQRIDQGLKKAQLLGFTLPENIYYCVALFFFYSPIFYRHNAIQKLWSQPASEQQHLQSLSEKITSQQWQQIAQQTSMADWMDIPETPISLQ